MTQRERDRLVALNQSRQETAHPKAGRPVPLAARGPAPGKQETASRRTVALGIAADSCKRRRLTMTWRLYFSGASGPLSSPNPSTRALGRRWRRSICSSATAPTSAAKRRGAGWPRPVCGSSANASWHARTRGGRSGVAAASWSNGTTPSTTGWRGAARNFT